MLFFRFAGKSAEEIQATALAVQGREIMVQGCGRSHGVIRGVLSTNSFPVGLAVVFEKVEQANQMRACMVHPAGNAVSP